MYNTRCLGLNALLKPGVQCLAGKPALIPASGHTRTFSSIAYIPDLVPSGVTVVQLK